MLVPKIAISFCSLVAVATLALPAAAESIVNVKLWDKGGAMDLSMNMELGMGMHGDMAKAIMGIETDQKSVPSGNVTFKVTNVSAATIHEMLVSPLAGADAVLPFIEKENRVDEEASGDLGEVSELDPGESGALTLDLKPGLYVLFCNVPGHYTAGMWTTLEVK